MAENRAEPSRQELSFEKVSWPFFLESVAPGTMCLIDVEVTTRMISASPLGVPTVGPPPSETAIAPAELQLHCPNAKCGGVRSFTTSAFIELEEFVNHRFLTFVCRNCREDEKVFALWIIWAQNKSMLAMKFGETPPFGPPVPSRVISLVGPDRDLFLRGRRAENQGLGIGAFAYYRRVIENQKGRLIEQIGKVAQRVDPSHPSLEVFASAAAESQFSKALDMIAPAFPQKLLIKGENPLRLLHHTTSEGIHDLSEEECLQRAEAVRVVMFELADRLSEALKDEAELERAIATLKQPRRKGETRTESQETSLIRLVAEQTQPPEAE